MYQSWLPQSVQTAALLATWASVQTCFQRYRIDFEQEDDLEHRTYY
jgi:hypothetical protein